jgi:undecaprenyl-diphosphatase
MILASAALNIGNDEFVKTFEVAIQLGAIMAIVLLYARKFLTSFKLYPKLIVAVIPALAIGFLAHSFIKAYLFNAIVVSVTLIIGGVILILIDKWLVGKESEVAEVEDLSYAHALKIGFAQCAAMIPGVSRAAASIVGGVFNGFNKKQATEFSFLLAVPTMVAATGYDLLKTVKEGAVVIGSHEIKLLIIGSVVAFIFAWIAVKIFLKLVENYGFKHFGYYRIIIGIAFLTWYLLGGNMPTA